MTRSKFIRLKKEEPVKGRARRGRDKKNLAGIAWLLNTALFMKYNILLRLLFFIIHCTDKTIELSLQPSIKCKFCTDVILGVSASYGLKFYQCCSLCTSLHYWLSDGEALGSVKCPAPTFPKFAFRVHGLLQVGPTVF